MKCQILFSGKNKKNISKCRLLKILPRVLSVNRSLGIILICVQLEIYCGLLNIWLHFHQFIPTVPKKDICKQCRPKSDATKRGV